MGKSSLQNFKLGVFVVLGTLLLVVAAYLIGNRQNMFTRNFTISALFRNTNGLQNGNNVRFSGINVGTVSKIEMHNDTTIEVYMVIEEKMQSYIRKNAVATIGSDGLVGSMLVNILPTSQDAPLIEPGDQVRSYSKIATQDMLNTLNVTNENAALLTADLLEVSQALTRGEGTLGRLLKDTTMANNLEVTLANLRQLSTRSNTLLERLDNTLNSLDFEESAAGVLLSDSTSARQLREIIGNLESSSSELKNMSRDLNEVVGDFREEPGLVYYLSKDSTLVERLERTLQNIEKGTEGFNENMEALKHNFLTRGYFRKLERQQKKAARKQEKSRND